MEKTYSDRIFQRYLDLRVFQENIAPAYSK